MKKILFLSGVLFSLMVSAQNQLMNEIVVTAPSYKSTLYGSINELLNHSVEYPHDSKRAGLQGTEIIQFTVLPSGNITHIKVINSVSKEIDKEIIRIINFTDGNWNPGSVNGKPEKMIKEISVAFYLQSFDDVVKKAHSYMQKGNKMMFNKDNPEKALKYYNKTATLLPYEEKVLAIKGYCQYQLGNKSAANNNWNRLKELADQGKTTNNLDQLLKANSLPVEIETLVFRTEE